MLSEYLRDTYGLSEKGSKDLAKASIMCAVHNLCLMIPVVITFFFLSELFLPLTEGVMGGLDVWPYVVAIIASLVLLFVATYAQYNATYLASYSETANTRITLAEKMRRLPLSFFAKKDSSDLTTVLMSDVAMLETAFSHFIPELFGAIFSTTLIGVGLLAFDWRMGIATLWVLPVSMAFLLLGRRKMDEVNGMSIKAHLEDADSIQECLETIGEIKSNNQTDRFKGIIDEGLRNVERSLVRAELVVGVLVTIPQMILRLGIATVVLYGSVLLIDGQLDLLTFIMFLIVASRVYDPISGAMQNLAAVFATKPKVERMKEIQRMPVQKGAFSPDYGGYDITFEHVDFSYGDSENVIRDLSFTAKQGEVTALVGPSGSGKSTAARLAARFWDVDGGKVYLGGTDISNVDPETLLKNYSIVFQDVTLFNNTVRENIRIGRMDATEEELMAAAKAARCDDFVRNLPDGYDTMIGENGLMLSGGERQRISIARAILKDSPIVILDESTASLDSDNETQIQSAISELITDKTVIIIAHRMRTVTNVDKIVVIDGGRAVQTGSPKELYAQEGLFRQMLDIQRADLSLIN